MTVDGRWRKAGCSRRLPAGADGPQAPGATVTLRLGADRRGRFRREHALQWRRQRASGSHKLLPWKRPGNRPPGRFAFLARRSVRRVWYDSQRENRTVEWSRRLTPSPSPPARSSTITPSSTCGSRSSSWNKRGSGCSSTDATRSSASPEASSCAGPSVAVLVGVVLVVLAHVAELARARVAATAATPSRRKAGRHALAFVVVVRKPASRAPEQGPGYLVTGSQRRGSSAAPGPHASPGEDVSSPSSAWSE
jgi:hypothetical protein